MSDISFEQALKVISKEAMEQYEQVRRGGWCNMFSVDCVVDIAEALGFDALAEAYPEHYSAIWQNFGALMEHYGIER